MNLTIRLKFYCQDCYVYMYPYLIGSGNWTFIPSGLNVIKCLGNILLNKCNVLTSLDCSGCFYPCVFYSVQFIYWCMYNCDFFYKFDCNLKPFHLASCEFSLDRFHCCNFLFKLAYKCILENQLPNKYNSYIWKVLSCDRWMPVRREFEPKQKALVVIWARRFKLFAQYWLVTGMDSSVIYINAIARFIIVLNSI